MSYPIVPHPTLTPSQCLLTKKAGIPCIDLMRDFDFDHQGRMYLSVSAAMDLGRLVGLVAPEKLEALESENASLTSELDQLRAELEVARAQLSAIDVIESADFRARKKAGRKAALNG
jgi:hypothetical protein